MRLASMVWHNSEEEAVASFAVSKMTTRKLTQGQFDACVLFCLRVSISTFYKSHLLTLINKRKDAEASAQFFKYCHDRFGLNKKMLADREQESSLYKGTTDGLER